MRIDTEGLTFEAWQQKYAKVIDDSNNVNVNHQENQLVPIDELNSAAASQYKHTWNSPNAVQNQDGLFIKHLTADDFSDNNVSKQDVIMEHVLFKMNEDGTSTSNYDEVLSDLRKNGLKGEIDWGYYQKNGFAADKVNDYGNVLNANAVENTLDKFASQYAVLKNRIETEYRGSEQNEQMNILNELFEQQLDEYSNGVSQKIGGFYESIGMNDGAAVVHKMIKDSVAQQIDGYGKYIKENPDYAKIAGTDDAWLSKADSFLSSELRKEYHGAADTDNSFSQLQDLAVFTEDAKEILYGQGLGLGGTRYAGISEEELDVNLGITSIRIETLLDNSSISDDFKDAIRNFMPEYNEDIIKKADAFAGEMRNALVEKNGLEHPPINKQSVYDVLEKMTKTYKNTKDAFAAIKDGVQYGSTQFEKKHTSNTGGNARYENSAFWENMFEKKHSYTQKTTLDSILTEMNDFLSYAGQAQGYSENRLDKRA